MARYSLLLGMLFSSLAFGGTTGGGDLSPCMNKQIFIDSMPQNFGNYMTSEILAQKINLKVTQDGSKAGCSMKGTVDIGGPLNLGSASVQIVDRSGDVIWSATSGDKDSVKDLAHNLAKQLKHDLPNGSRNK